MLFLAVNPDLSTVCSIIAEVPLDLKSSYMLEVIIWIQTNAAITRLVPVNYSFRERINYEFWNVLNI